MFIGIHEIYLANAVVVIPLLQKFLLVGRRIPLDEVLQLRQVRCEEEAASHSLF